MLLGGVARHQDYLPRYAMASEHEDIGNLSL
jgi:hypothetical protein